MNREIIEKTFLKYEKIIFFSIFLLFLLILRIDYDFLEKVDWYYKQKYDHWYYIRMSKDITSIFKYEIEAPFCYRPLIPFIAWILPFDPQVTYYLISFISIYFTGILLYYTLRLYFNRKLSVIGLLIFCSVDIIDDSFYNIYMMDAPVFLFMMICFYAILTSNNKVYCVSLLIGVLIKETILFTIPVFLIHNIYFEEDEPLQFEISKEYFKDFLKYIHYTVPGLLAFVIIRLIVRPLEGGKYDNYFIIILNQIKSNSEFLLNNPTHYLFLITMYGYLTWFFCIFNSRNDIIKWIKLYGIFIALVYLQLLIAYSIARILYAGFFPIIFLSISGLNRIIQNLNHNYDKNIIINRN